MQPTRSTSPQNTTPSSTSELIDFQPNKRQKVGDGRNDAEILPRLLDSHIQRIFKLSPSKVSAMTKVISSTAETEINSPTNKPFKVVNYTPYIPQESASRILPLKTWLKVDRVAQLLEIRISEANIYAEGGIKDVFRGHKFKMQLPLSNDKAVDISNIALHILKKREQIYNDQQEDFELRLNWTHNGILFHEAIIANKIQGIAPLPICLNGQINIADDLATEFEQRWFPSDLERAWSKGEVLCPKEACDPEASDTDELAITFHKIDDTSRVLLDVCKTLIEMHHIGFGHGDIKPGNILIDYDKRFKGYLSDFDLASTIPGRTRKITEGDYIHFDDVALHGYITKFTDIYGIGILLALYFLPNFLIQTPKDLIYRFFCTGDLNKTKALYKRKMKEHSDFQNALIDFTCDQMKNIVEKSRTLKEFVISLPNTLDKSDVLVALNSKIDEIAPNLLEKITTEFEEILTKYKKTAQ